jgi:hypothetical protein
MKLEKQNREKKVHNTQIPIASFSKAFTANKALKIAQNKLKYLEFNTSFI